MKGRAAEDHIILELFVPFSLNYALKLNYEIKTIIEG